MKGKDYRCAGCGFYWRETIIRPCPECHCREVLVGKKRVRVRAQANLVGRTYEEHERLNGRKTF